MNLGNNVDMSQSTTVDKFDGITGVGAQNSSSQTVSAARLNLSGSTCQVDQLTFQTGVQGGCSQESFAVSTDPTPLSLSLTPGEITPLSVLKNLDSQPTIVPTPTSDNKDFTHNKTAATGLLLFVQTPEEVHETVASSNRGRGALARVLAQAHSTPTSTQDMAQTRSNNSKKLSNAPLSDRSHLRRNQPNQSKAAAKGSPTDSLPQKRIPGSSNPPGEPPTKKPRITSGITPLKSKPPIATNSTKKGTGRNLGRTSGTPKRKDSGKPKSHASVPTPRVLDYC